MPVPDQFRDDASVIHKMLELQDSGFRHDDESRINAIFYEIVKIRLDSILISDVSEWKFQFTAFVILEIGSPHTQIFQFTFPSTVFTSELKPFDTSKVNKAKVAGSVR